MEKALLIKKYFEYIKNMGKQPNCVELCNWLGEADSCFYEHFKSADDLQRYFWKEKMTKTLKILEESTEYDEYNMHERLLAFYFTWFDQISENHDYTVILFKNSGVLTSLPGVMKAARQLTTQYTNELIADAEQSGEIPKRMLVNNYIHNIIEYQWIYLTNFWVDDRSQDFSKTDAAVEKSVALVFDIIGRNLVDNSIDFGKFWLQNSQWLPVKLLRSIFK